MAEYIFRDLGGDNFEVAKFDGGEVPLETYQIHLGRAPFCRCPAFASGRTRPCKHMKGLNAWIAGGKKLGSVNLASEKAGKKGKRSKPRVQYLDPGDEQSPVDEPPQEPLGDMGIDESDERFGEEEDDGR